MTLNNINYLKSFSDKLTPTGGFIEINLPDSGLTSFELGSCLFCKYPILKDKDLKLFKYDFVVTRYIHYHKSAFALFYDGRNLVYSEEFDFRDLVPDPTLLNYVPYRISAGGYTAYKASITPFSGLFSVPLECQSFFDNLVISYEKYWNYGRWNYVILYSPNVSADYRDLDNLGYSSPLTSADLKYIFDIYKKIII